MILKDYPKYYIFPPDEQTVGRFLRKLRDKYGIMFH
jgi:hypothetical protein